LQHVVFFCVWLIAILVPDIPETLNITKNREKYLAKQALADAETVELVSSTIVAQLLDLCAA